MTQSVLIDMPFMSAHRPNLALSLLKAAANHSGFDCDILYAKLRFAEKIGLETYRVISDLLPSEFLVGDVIFASSLRDVSVEKIVEEYKQLHVDKDPHNRSMPITLWDEIESICEVGASYVEEFSEFLSCHECCLIGLSLTFHLTPGLALAKAVKQKSPDKLIVLGGAYCEGPMGASLINSFPWVDVVVRGDGEDAFVEIIRRVNSCNRVEEEGPVFSEFDLSEIPGVAWRCGNKIILNSGIRATNQRSLNDIPEPHYEDWFLQLSASSLPIPKEKTILPLETSRGCWFGEKSHCIFCGLNGESLKFRSKSPLRVVQEILTLAKYGVKSVDAVDLILDNSYLSSVLPLLKEIDHKLSIFYEIKANLKRFQVRSLQEAGITMVQPGIESMSSVILSLMRKGAKAYHNIRLLKWCSEFGIRVEWNLLYGIPGENVSDYDNMISIFPLIQHLPPPSGGCARLLMNRFSPMFNHQQNFGISNVRPVSAYQIVLGKEVDIDNVAYYFDHEISQNSDYLDNLRNAVQNWQNVFGTVALVAVDRSNELILFDTRTIAKKQEIKLSGVYRSVYLACDGGTTVANIQNALQISEKETQDILHYLCSLQVMLEIDNRYLTLAVTMDEYATPFLDSQLLGLIVKNLYTERMRLVFTPAEKANLPEPAGIEVS